VDTTASPRPCAVVTLALPLPVRAAKDASRTDDGDFVAISEVSLLAVGVSRSWRLGVAVSLFLCDLMHHHDARLYLAISTERDQRGLD
jgi:hypothetical protein